MPKKMGPVFRQRAIRLVREHRSESFVVDRDNDRGRPPGTARPQTVCRFAQRIVAWNAPTSTSTYLLMTPLRIALWQRDREGHDDPR